MYTASGYSGTELERLVETTADAINESEPFDSEHRAIFVIARAFAQLEACPDKIGIVLAQARQLSEHLPEYLRRL